MPIGGRLLTAVAILATAASASAETVSGRVVDPQGTIVVGAVVSIGCAGVELQTRTDGSGRFAIDYETPASPCALAVTYPGLEPYTTRDARVAPKTITLRLAGIAETVRVDASGPTGSHRLFTLDPEDLRLLGPDVNALVSLAKFRSGAIGADDVLYVDGLPAATVPPAASIAEITVNDDPLSAEFAEAFQNRIDVVTRSPEPRFRMSANGTGVGFGGRNMLVRGDRPAEHGGVLNATVPIGRWPVVLAGALTFSQQRTDRPLLATEPATVLASETQAKSVHAAAYVDRSPRLLAYAALTRSVVRNRNEGAGGITLPEAAFATNMGLTDLRASMRLGATSYRYRGGLAWTRTQSDIASNGTGIGIFIPDTIVTGGSLVASRRALTGRWATRHVLDFGAGGRWMVGLSASHQKDGVVEHPSAAGTLRFDPDTQYADATAGTARATWFIDHGLYDGSRADRQLAIFGQRTIAAAGTFVTRLGARADYQQGDGLLLLPRLTTSVERGGFVVRAGGGLFVQPWANAVTLAASRSDGVRFTRSFARRVGLSDIAGAVSEAVLSAIDPELRRERDLVVRTSIERPLRVLDLGAEYTWLRGSHLLGSRRLRQERGWTDLLESNRTALRHQLELRLARRSDRYDLSGRYTWVRATDDGSAPFAFPARQDDVAGEWARTAGLSPHNANISARLRLPAQIACSIAGRWTSVAPYDVTTGRDVFGNGLYTDRGGLGRNSGVGPVFASLDAFVYKRVDLPRSMHADVRVQAANLLDARNDSALGSIVGSRRFGQPLATFPGRSVKISVGFD